MFGYLRWLSSFHTNEQSRKFAKQLSVCVCVDMQTSSHYATNFNQQIGQSDKSERRHGCTLRLYVFVVPSSIVKRQKCSLIFVCNKTNKSHDPSSSQPDKCLHFAASPFVAYKLIVPLGETHLPRASLKKLTQDATHFKSFSSKLLNSRCEPNRTE